jgi:N utilization substance protein B
VNARRKGRIVAFQALYAWDVGKNSPDELLEFDWVSQELPSEVADFARLLLTGTLESVEQVDATIRDQLEHWDFSRLAKVDLAVLRMSVYSLLYRREIPAKVTIDEAIDIAKEFGSSDSYRFVNGMLDGIRKRLAIS